jgi:hypothetical protein
VSKSSGDKMLLLSACGQRVRKIIQEIQVIELY